MNENIADSSTKENTQIDVIQYLKSVYELSNGYFINTIFRYKTNEYHRLKYYIQKYPDTFDAVYSGKTNILRVNNLFATHNNIFPKKQTVEHDPINVVKNLIYNSAKIDIPIKKKYEEIFYEDISGVRYYIDPLNDDVFELPKGGIILTIKSRSKKLYHHGIDTYIPSPLLARHAVIALDEYFKEAQEYSYKTQLSSSDVLKDYQIDGYDVDEAPEYDNRNNFHQERLPYNGILDKNTGEFLSFLTGIEKYNFDINSKYTPELINEDYFIGIYAPKGETE